MSLAVKVEELQALLSHENAFTRPFGFRVESVEDGVCTLNVPFRREWERPGGIVSGIVFMTAADVAMWLAIKTKSGARRHFRHEPHADVLSPERQEAKASSAGRRSCGPAGGRRTARRPASRRPERSSRTTP